MMLREFKNYVESVIFEQICLYAGGSMKEPILKDLCALIRKSTIHYNETCEQRDVVLSDEFQDLFGKYLRNKNYTVDFYEHTAVISTPAYNYMFVPNQWFVIASYAVGVLIELMKYKQYLLDVCDYMGEKPKILVPKLRDDTSSVNKQLFFDGCRAVFNNSDEAAVTLASERLWRFATDYSWWSGNKTADRGDFYLSVVLNMLSLVAASQSYVGEIVNIYYQSGLASMVAELSDFTETASGATYAIDDYHDPRENASEMIIPQEPEVDDGDEILIAVSSRRKK